MKDILRYPQRDASALVGELDELSAWHLLYNIATQAQTLTLPIFPENIFLDGFDFVLCDAFANPDECFIAPEGYEPAWALGATVFYLVLGCHVMHGRGGKAQTSSTPIPTLRGEMPQLSRMIKRCLDFNPQMRPSIEEIASDAEKNMTRCKAQRSEFPPIKENHESVTADIDKFWPDEMY